MQLKNKVVIVTGSANGIGRQIVYAFAREGAHLVITTRSNSKDANETLQQAKKFGSKGFVFQGDLSDENTVKKLFAQTLRKFKRVDILVNNAGRTWGSTLEKTDKQHWLKNFNDNFFTTVLCSKEAIGIMRKQKGGKIINTASILGIEHGGREGAIAYSAAKAAVINFTNTLAKDVAPTILVNAVAPGRTQTAYYDQFDEKTMRYFKDGCLIGRMIRPEEIAEAFLFIAKNDAMTGSLVVVDGGYTIKHGNKL